MIRFLGMLHCCQKRILSLNSFGKNTMSHSVYFMKMHNSTTSMSTPFTALSVQIYSTFSPTTIKLHAVAKNVKFDSTFSFFIKAVQNNTKSTVTKTMLSCTHVFSNNAQLCYTVLAITGSDKKKFRKSG